MFFKKRDFKAEILKALEKNDLTQVVKLSESAFDKEPQNEELLSYVSAIIFEKQIWSAVKLIPEFVNRFPYSLHAIRIYFADILSRQNRFDASTTEARIYLRLVKDNNLLENCSNDIIKNSIGQGFLFLTSAYTSIGARSYSSRVLKLGSKYVSDYWKNIYSDELKMIDKELQETNNRESDSKWEDFFNTGNNSDSLFKLAKNSGFDDLSKRVDLIESNFRFNSSYKVNELEIFQIIYENNGTFVLN
jgi:hypothetical protein